MSLECGNWPPTNVFLTALSVSRNWLRRVARVIVSRGLVIFAGTRRERAFSPVTLPPLYFLSGNRNSRCARIRNGFLLHLATNGRCERMVLLVESFAHLSIFVDYFSFLTVHMDKLNCWTEKLIILGDALNMTSLNNRNCPGLLNNFEKIRFIGFAF